MSRITDQWLKCAFYIYPSRPDAEAGRSIGGSGFFVSIGWADNQERRHVYAVTNKHVIMQCVDRVVIRATTKRGEIHFEESDDVQWTPSPTDDLSAIPIKPELAELFESVPERIFVNASEFETNDIELTPLGPGDEVFMIGRFISHDGKEKNHPSVRFGNISMNAAGLRHPGGYLQESIAVDMRSMSGYSGSPAFVYWEFGGNHLINVRRPFHQSFFGLLGVDWGHIPLDLPVLDKADNPVDGQHVRSHTSMSGVVPAWRLRELLDLQPFKHQRAMIEQEERKNPTPLWTLSVEK